jgi:hypothetical protein
VPRLTRSIFPSRDIDKDTQDGIDCSGEEYGGDDDEEVLHDKVRNFIRVLAC